MTFRSSAIIGLAIVASWTTVMLAQTPPPAAQPAEQEEAALVETVAVTVNGHPITKSEIDARCDAVIKAQSRGRPIPPEQLAQFRERMVPQLLEVLIENLLLDEDVTKAQIKVTDAELAAEIERLLQAQLEGSGDTRAEFEIRIKGRMKMSLEEFLATQAADPDFKQSILHMRLLEKKYDKEMTVTAEAIKAHYEENLERDYTEPARVQASHILIGTKGTMTEEEKTAARTRAEMVLAEARQPEADFAALASQHSTDSSRARGGELGFFPRYRAMVEPFAAAAFALDTGEISDIVETQYGYHIIKVTDKKAAVAIPIEQVSQKIKEILKVEKLGDLRKRHLAALRKTAEITYPEPNTPQPAP